MEINEIPSLKSTIIRQTIIFAILVTLLLSLISALMTGVLLFKTYKESNIEETHQAADLVEVILDEQALHLNNLVKHVEMASKDEIKEQLSIFMQDFPSYHSVWITDSRGKVLCSTNSSTDMVGFNMSRTEAFQMRGDTVIHFSSVFMSPTLRKPVITISRKLFDGIIALEYPTENLNKALETVTNNLIRVLTLTDNHATWLVHPQKEMITQREVDSYFTFVHENFNGEPLSFLRRFNGKRTYSSVIVTKRSSWIISIHQALSTILFPVLNVVVIVFLVSFLFSLVLIFFIRRTIYTSFKEVNKLMFLSQKLGFGDYEYESSPALYREIEELRRSFVDMGTNIHDREIKQNELWEQLLQSQKMEAVGILAGGIAHDFNNILTAIGGFSELLTLKLPQESEEWDYASEIESSVERATALTQQLLTFSRKEQVCLTVFDLIALINNMQKMLVRIIGENIGLQTHLPQGAIWLRADPHQLEQIILNLTVNARDALLTVDIDTPLIEISVIEGKESGSITVSIKDNGPGIPLVHRDKVFEPFFTTKGMGKGTGMGLSMVYGIVEQNNGTIELVTEEGRGTEFLIHWPVMEVEEIETSSIIEEKKSREIPSKRILLVDDETSLLKVGQAMLTRLGHRVYTAESAYDALEELERVDSMYDLMITDVIMPQITGDKLAQIVREKYPRMKIVFTSGYTDDHLSRLEEEMNESNFIAKPFRMDDISHLLQLLF